MFTQRFRKLIRLDVISSQRTFVRDFSYYTFAVLTWLPAAIFFNEHIGECTSINGASMYPFLNTSYHTSTSRDFCWIAKWNAYKNVQRGMIVSFRSPTNPEITACKRVLAIAGDTVFTRAPCPVPTVSIPTNHIWVEGDNKDGRKSLDSNHYGPIPLSLVEGKVTHVVWPWASSGRVRWEDWKGDRTRVIRGRRESAPGWN